MGFEDAVTLAIPGSYIILLIVEQLWPARSFLKLPFWKLTGAVFFLLMGAVSTLLPMALPPDVLARVRLMDLSGLASSAACRWAC